MADKKPGAGESTGQNLLAEPSSAREASTSARANARPAASMRRDPRADPDDEPISARVDVVTMDRGASGNQAAAVDALTNAALTLRRELAKLHQQAAAVERTIEDQRRERSEVIERIGQANARADELAHRLELSESEVGNVRRLHDAALEDLQSVRAERDDLLRAIDAAKGAAEELAQVRTELATSKTEREDALRSASTFEMELAEIRKREAAETQKATDTEREQGALRERLDRMTAELAQAREETTESKGELARLRQEASDAAEAAAKKHADLERERASTLEEIGRLGRALDEARAAAEKVSVLEGDLSTARVEAAEARVEINRLERDVEAARRARDVNLERALMAEREAESARKDIERLQRELEAAAVAATNATARAAAAERTRAGVEESVKQLRDEVTTAFARWRSTTPSTPPMDVGSVAPPTRAVIPVSREVSEAPPVTRRGGTGSTSFPPPAAEARPLTMPPPSAVPEPLDDAWPTTSQAPPKPDAGEADAAAAARGRTVPPPAPILEEPATRSDPPPPSAQAIPPPGDPSTPSPAGATPTGPPPAPSEPPARPAEAPSGVRILSDERDELFERLSEPNTAREAAVKLLERPEWLRGRPPLELLMALTHLDYDVEAPLFEIARTWEREPLSRALIAALRDEPEPKLREHGAWLLKHLGAPSAWPALAELVSNESEPPSVRRWLLEAIERLVVARAIGWREVGDLVHLLVRNADATLRDGVIGVVAALERSEDKRRVLLEILRTDDDEAVLASAVHALASALPIELDPAVAERLLGHPSARVQRSVVEFIERSKRTATKA